MNVLQRKRLRYYTNDMMNYPYSYIFAPWGSGKSTWKKHIMKDFKKRDIKCIECSSFQELASFYPFPDEHVYILDDVEDELMNAWESKAHIICFSEKKPNALMLRLLANQLCFWVDASALLFTKNEIVSLWYIQHITLTTQDVDQLHIESNGWIFALQLLFYKYPPLQKINIIQEVYRHILPLDDIKFLCKLSMLSKFSEEQAFFILRNKNTYQTLRQLQQSCAFLVKDKHSYHFLPMFQEALEQDMKTYHISKKRYYHRCVEYYQNQHRYFDAFQLLYFLHDFEAIYRMVDVCEFVFLDDLEEDCIALCINVDEALIKQYPTAYIHFLTYFISYIDAKRGNQYLQDFKAFTKLHYEEPIKSKLLAEIYLSESILYHDDIPKCGLYNFKAYNLLDGNMIDRSTSVYVKTHGSYQLLFIFYNQLGNFESIYENLYHRSIMYNEIVNFTNLAYILQLEGEYAYENGLYHDAIHSAKEVMYHVDKEKDVSLYCAALYLLAKAAILNGHQETFDFTILTLKDMMNDASHIRRKQLLECIQANLGIMAHQYDLIAPWLKQFELYRTAGAFCSSIQCYITIAKVAVAMHDFELLQKAILPIIEINKTRHYIYATIYIELFQAFLIMNTHKKEAYEIFTYILTQSEKDHITSIFLEFSNILYPFLSGLSHTPYLKDILDKMQQVLAFQRNSKPDYSVLSPKEYEVFLLLKEGKSRDDIAELFAISLNTVKFHMKNIYKKLDIHSHRELLNDFASPIFLPRLSKLDKSDMY